MVSAPLAYSGFLGLTAVIAGAVGSHGLSNKTPQERNSFLTGSNYQVMHSIAALAALSFSNSLKAVNKVASTRLQISAYMFLAGTTLFSGTVYARVLGAPKSIGKLAPTGGVLLMGGWACLIAAALAL